MVFGSSINALRFYLSHEISVLLQGKQEHRASNWLAKDRRQSRLVALKISTAKLAERTHEIQILSQLTRAKTELPGKAIVQNLLNSFTFPGPNGSHRCLVMDAARMNQYP